MKLRRKNNLLAYFLILAMSMAIVGCTPESPPLDPPTLTPTEVLVGVPSDTPTPVPSVFATPTMEPTVTNSPAPTEEVLSVTPTEEVTPTATPTDEPVVTETPTPEPTATNIPVPTNTPTKEPTKVPTKAPDTPTPRVELTVTMTPTKAPTKAPTQPPATNTPTPKPTATNTPTPEPTPTQAVGYVVPPLLDTPVTMWVKENNTGLIVADAYYESRANGSFVTSFSGTFLQKGDEVSVIRAKDDCGYVSIRSGNTIGLISINALSETLVEGKWAEPRERKDLEEILMAKVNAYRESMGVPKFESPFVYFDEFEPNAGANMTAEGLAVAKEQCLKQDAQHNGRQIGTGWYGSAIRQKQGGLTNEQLCEKLFQQWKNSPGHNANMLDNRTEDGYRIMVAVMTVVEYYDGYSYGYCAIMTHNRPIVAK